jgi:drug/metabolite transporter (DMT)-like permease
LKARDLVDMLLIGAIWGGAFPLLRIAAPEFGPIALIGVRVAIAALVLLALLPARGRLRQHARPLFVLAMLNAAIPFTLFAYATLGVTAGIASLLNATTPMFGAILAFLWLGERLTGLQVLGIGLGFAGIASIVWNEVGTHSGTSALAVAAGLGGAALYGAAASYARRRLDGVDPLVVATGCVCGAALVMVPAAALAWPQRNPGALAWACAVGLGLFCTALAYVLYFRLLPRIGAARSVTVTFLIPVFGILWGAALLGEPLTRALLVSCAVVLTGTALAMGLWPRRRQPPAERLAA